MEDRTFGYLTGRFRDYYRNAALELPPDADEREWGYIPWRQSGKSVMIRHLSTLEVGDPTEFLHAEVPRHVYTSASRYEDPGADNMDEKRWTNSDLIFDIDIDESHLPDYIEADELAYDEELALAKTHLERLLLVLDRDFGFEDIDISFSGGRGYHVHVRDEHVKDLSSKHRTEIVSYVQGVNLDVESLTRENYTTIGTRIGNQGIGFKPDGGWSSRVHERMVAVAEKYRQIADELLVEEAEAQLVQEFDGIGSTKATHIIAGFQNHLDDIRAGHVNPTKGMKSLARAVTKEVQQDTYADIDEPVTTDVNRLIRLPGSLHGRTGFRVSVVSPDQLDSFDPLTDAIPDTFTGRDIGVDVTTASSVRMLNDEFEFEPGDHQVPEPVGIYLMAQGLAEKTRE
jgi:DNA primase small subunit